ncbi:TIGR02117 family protein [Variovorax sp. dw_308]|uniref:TIGR02117 family protein n=1 Tax=Variovorax sp. dw_308 TaxID=2721546 RepID=UPI001C48EDB8|nr:TIGR02117 family protein [Variovorax sp. dw_308]
MWRLLLCVAMVPVIAALAYVAIASALMFWPANATPPAEDRAIEAWVLSNGVHTDIVLPLRGHGTDWSQTFLPADFRAAPPDADYIAIGWGDRDFYLYTPTWADLTVKRALGALAGIHSAVLHVTYLRRAEFEKLAHRVPLSQRQYDVLRDYVRASLPQGRAAPVAGVHYAANDAFYEAEGRYSMVETCNNWTGRGLRLAGVTVSRWSPFDFNVVRHLPPRGVAGSPGR